MKKNKDLTTKNNSVEVSKQDKKQKKEHKTQGSTQGPLGAQKPMENLAQKPVESSMFRFRQELLKKQESTGAEQHDKGATKN